MFAVDLARVFGMSRIVVPAAAGVGSAVGLLHADLSVEQLRTRVLAADEAHFPAVMDIFAQLSATALESLGQDPSRVLLRRSIDIRYRGQAHQLPVPLTEQDLNAGPDAVLAAFRGVYESTYGVAQEAPAEFVTYRVRALAPFDAGQPVIAESAAGQGVMPAGSRRATFSAGEGFVDVPVLRRADLGSGYRVTGPAFVEGPESTTLLPPGALLTVDTLETLHLWPEGEDVG
jgi:N-methylhydantoinase A/oxoprolinase/acetone carboxylase beta subunit